MPESPDQLVLKTLLTKLSEVIKGKNRILELLVTALIAGGHVLVEDVPGLGKTTLAKALAKLIRGEKGKKSVVFRRIQFTPDLLPYDITGVDVFNPKSRKFRFVPGPIFANLVLADEINRTTPKVQSALLEVMAENQVTVGGKTYKLDDLFFVIATQNPIETEGVYPLPISQRDRFLMMLHIGYPDESVEAVIVKENPAEKILPRLKPVCDVQDILHMRQSSEKVFCDDRLVQTVVSVSAATRKHGGIEVGASPRASLMLVKTAKAYALVKGRSYVVDQDLVDLAALVLAHRLIKRDPQIDERQLIRDIVIQELARLRY